MHSGTIYIVNSDKWRPAGQAPEGHLYQRDYILRMIEEMGVILVRLREMILGGASDRRMVDGEIRKVAHGIGFDIDVARIADDATLERMVAPTGALEPGRGWLIAECFYLHGLEAQLDERAEEARASLSRALRLFGLLAPDALLPSGFTEAALRIQEIERRLIELDGKHPKP